MSVVKVQAPAASMRVPSITRRISARTKSQVPIIRKISRIAVQSPAFLARANISSKNAPAVKSHRRRNTL
jgi:hypothetical protein